MSGHLLLGLFVISRADNSVKARGISDHIGRDMASRR